MANWRTYYVLALILSQAALLVIGPLHHHQRAGKSAETAVARHDSNPDQKHSDESNEHCVLCDLIRSITTPANTAPVVLLPERLGIAESPQPVLASFQAPQLPIQGRAPPMA